MSPILTDQNDPLVINGLELMKLDEVDVMSFSLTLLSNCLIAFLTNISLALNIKMMVLTETMII